jgi:hypothetical protein
VHQSFLVSVDCCVCGVSLVGDMWNCVLVCVRVGCLLAGWVCNWNALLYNMFRMMYSSFLSSIFYRIYAFRRLCTDLIAAYVCCVGWLEVKGMIESVYVGFL